MFANFSFLFQYISYTLFAIVKLKLAEDQQPISHYNINKHAIHSNGKFDIF